MTATADTIAVALGRDPSGETEREQWEMWIFDAMLLLESRLTLADLDEARVDYVVREAVIAHIRNPEDATQVSVSVGDASQSKSYRSGAGRVTIRPEWWRLLDPDYGRGEAFTIDMVPDGTVHQPWCTLQLGGGYCSCGADIAGYPIYEL